MVKQHHCATCKSTITMRCIKRKHIHYCDVHECYTEKGRKCPACKEAEKRKAARGSKSTKEQQTALKEKIATGHHEWRPNESVEKGGPGKSKGSEKSREAGQQTWQDDPNGSSWSNNISRSGSSRWQADQAHVSTASRDVYNNTQYQNQAATTDEQHLEDTIKHDDQTHGNYTYKTHGAYSDNDYDDGQSYGAQNETQGNEEGQSSAQHGRTTSGSTQGSGLYYDYSSAQLASTQYGHHIPRMREDGAYTNNSLDDSAPGDLYGYEGEVTQHTAAQNQASEGPCYDYEVEGADQYDDGTGRHGHN